VATARLDPQRRNGDPAELAIFVIFALLSLWVLGCLVGRSLSNGQVWTGIDSLHASDPLQYLAFIRSAGHSILISNLFDIRPAAASFLHPGFLASGLISDLGVPPWLAYLLWKPVAVVAIFLAVQAYVHRFIDSTGGRRAALLLALFFVPTAAFVASQIGTDPRTNVYLLGTEVELFPGTWLWGYSFTVLAVAAIPAALLCYGRDRSRARVGPAGPAAALLCSWFQPWQGGTLLLILAATELLSSVVERPGKRPGGDAPGASRGPSAPERVRLVGSYLVAGVVPLVYYALLARLDPSWKLAGQANRFGAWPVWTLVVTLAPLAVPAALVYVRRPATTEELGLRLWPLAGLAVYWVIGLTNVGTFPIHAFQGLTIPLAILAVLGVRARVSYGRRTTTLATALVLTLFLVPALVWKLNDARHSTATSAVPLPGAPPNTYFLKTGESDALSFLDRDREPGGVLAAAGLGEVVPGRTGRRTWLGLPSWTPDYNARFVQADLLFNGRLSAPRAAALVRSTGARFVFEDCEHHADLAALLQPLVTGTRRFGCATVLRVRSA
jgi:hypothetical protein